MYLSRHFIETAKRKLGVPEGVDISILKLWPSSSQFDYGIAFILVDGETKVREYRFKTGK